MKYTTSYKKKKKGESGQEEVTIDERFFLGVPGLPARRRRRRMLRLAQRRAYYYLVKRRFLNVIKH